MISKKGTIEPYASFNIPKEYQEKGITFSLSEFSK